MTDTLASRLRPVAVAPIPASHLGLQWRQAVAEDRARFESMILRTERDDELVRRTPLGEIDRFISADPRLSDTLVGVDAAGNIQAFGAVIISTYETEVARAELFAVTMHRWRGKGIGRALLAWQDARSRQLLVQYFGAEATIPAQIVNVVDSTQIDRRRLYAAAGFSPRRTLSVLRHDISTPTPVPTPAANGTVEAWREDFRDAVKSLHLQRAVALGATSAQAEVWWRRVRNSMAPNLSFALTRAGEVRGYALTALHTAQWLAAGHTDATLELFGVFPDSDADISALIDAVIQAACADGVQGLAAEVDVTRHDDRARLFTRLGFTIMGTRMVYAIDV